VKAKQDVEDEPLREHSPKSSRFSSGSSSSGGSMLSLVHEYLTPRTAVVDADVAIESPERSPSALEYLQPASAPDVVEEFGDKNGKNSKRHSIVIHTSSPEEDEAPEPPPKKPSKPPSTETPDDDYGVWIAEVIEPLRGFIDGATDPREHYVDLQEIAEGESGSVYAARFTNGRALKLPAPVSSPPPSTIQQGMVAIKNVPILQSGSPKLDDLQRELKLMKGLRHENLLGMDMLYVDLVEASLWIRMELMERSLADVVGLVEEGLMVQERMIARFASDVSCLAEV
jgi:hypothetical protein